METTVFIFLVAPPDDDDDDDDDDFDDVNVDDVDGWIAMHSIRCGLWPIVTDVTWSVCVCVLVCLGRNREPYRNG